MLVDWPDFPVDSRLEKKFFVQLKKFARKRNWMVKNCLEGIPDSFMILSLSSVIGFLSSADRLPSL
jgi:hypothetical protein